MHLSPILEGLMAKKNCTHRLPSSRNMVAKAPSTLQNLLQTQIKVSRHLADQSSRLGQLPRKQPSLLQAKSWTATASGRRPLEQQQLQM